MKLILTPSLNTLRIQFCLSFGMGVLISESSFKVNFALLNAYQNSSKARQIFKEYTQRTNQLLNQCAF